MKKIDQAIELLTGCYPKPENLSRDRGELLHQLHNPVNSRKCPEANSLLQDAVLELIREFPDGIRNCEVAEKLNIRSCDFNGKHRDYFSWVILRIMVNREQIKKEGEKYYPLS